LGALQTGFFLERRAFNQVLKFAPSGFSASPREATSTTEGGDKKAKRGGARGGRGAPGGALARAGGGDRGGRTRVGCLSFAGPGGLGRAAVFPNTRTQKPFLFFFAGFPGFGPGPALRLFGFRRVFRAVFFRRGGNFSRHRRKGGGPGPRQSPRGVPRGGGARGVDCTTGGGGGRGTPQKGAFPTGLHDLFWGAVHIFYHFDRAARLSRFRGLQEKQSFNFSNNV